MKTKAFIRKLATYYPQKLREKWDFGGLMVGSFPVEVTKVMLCLDFDDEIYGFALEQKPDLIITHHPFVFGPKRAVLERDPIKRDLYERMEKAGIPIVSYHTNFDNASPCGMNDELALRLGLEDVKPLETAPMARGGNLPREMEVHAFAEYAKKALDVSYGLLIAGGKKTVRSVAIIGGGASNENVNAQNEGYDIYISGDISHARRRDVVARKYNYLDLPHEIEKAFMARMGKTIAEIDPSIEVVSIDHEKLPEVI